VLATDLELPELDYLDPELRGERFHEVMDELARRNWLASSPIGFFVLDREAAAFFLRTKSATFPGMKIAEMFGIEDGPLYEEMQRNILHIDGDHHRRLRNLVNPAFTPRSADRWRPAMREFLAQLWEGVADQGRCEFVDAFAKPYPSLTIATVMGAPLEDAPRLHYWSNWIQRQFDGPSLMTERETIERWKSEGVYPYAAEPEPEAAVARAERALFDIVATTAAPAIDTSDKPAKRLSLGLLREAVENPTSLRRIIDDVLDLPEAKRAELERLLKAL